MYPPPGPSHPRILLNSAAARMGEAFVTDWCCRLILGAERPDDPDLGWLGGTAEWTPYWRRVWGARGLLYVWEDSVDATAAIRIALSDEHWRVREMACKVIRARSLDELFDEVMVLLDDEHPRVRAAADRARRRLD